MLYACPAGTKVSYTSKRSMLTTSTEANLATMPMYDDSRLFNYSIDLSSYFDPSTCMLLQRVLSYASG